MSRRLSLWNTNAESRVARLGLVDLNTVEKVEIKITDEEKARLERYDLMPFDCANGVEIAIKLDFFFVERKLY